METLKAAAKSRYARLAAFVIMAFALMSALGMGVGAAEVLSEQEINEVRLGTVTGNGVNLREEPNVTSKIYTMLAKGVQVAVIGESGEWGHVMVDGMDGYMNRLYLDIHDNGEADLGYGQVTASVINIRAFPSTTAAVQAMLTEGAYVKILGVYNGWYKVTTENGNYSGYIHPNYLSPSVEKPMEPVYVSGSGSSSREGTTKQSNWGSTLAGQLMSVAEQYLGVPYVWGGSSPSGFDCGGFTYYCYKKIGYTIPRTGQQNVGTYVPRSELRVGDLVFFSNSSSTYGHVGIYAGNGMFIHAPKPGSYVKYTTMASGWYSSHYVTARRILN